MNSAPIYIIHGEERRKMKKEYHGMRRFLKMFWFYEDIDRVYGGGMTDKEANNMLAEIEIKVKELEEKLNQKL
jgi:hypothetical protein